LLNGEEGIAGKMMVATMRSDGKDHPYEVGRSQGDQGVEHTKV
jgi:hypothetical protein